MHRAEYWLICDCSVGDLRWQHFQVLALPKHISRSFMWRLRLMRTARWESVSLVDVSVASSWHIWRLMAFAAFVIPVSTPFRLLWWLYRCHAALGLNQPLCCWRTCRATCLRFLLLTRLEVPDGTVYPSRKAVQVPFWPPFRPPQCSCSVVVGHVRNPLGLSLLRKICVMVNSTSVFCLEVVIA